MDNITEYKGRINKGIMRVDSRLLQIGDRLAQLLSEYRYFIAVMLFGLVIWVVVFNIALTDYLSSSVWKSRSAWLGPLPNPGEFNLFGYTILYQFEGYSDYSFFYVHWGYNMLNGYMPYTDAFGYLSLHGITNENGIFIFPPLTAYLYGAGIWLTRIIGPGNWGIGLLLASFGYLTAIPVYGIAKELSHNPRVGELAALTYLLNPLVLYHIDYIWLNPSAFYFFFFAGFYALVKRHNHVGIILIVSAALFKQTAWFLGIPLVVYLLLKPRERKESIPETKGPETSQTQKELEGKPTSEDSIVTGNVSSTEGTDVDKKRLTTQLQSLLDYFDFREFLIGVIVAASYAGAIMFPFLIAQPHFWNYWRVALGHFPFSNYTDLPSYGVPESLPVLAILFKKPALAKTLNEILITGGPMIFGVILFTGLMILSNKWKGEENLYLRRILYLTLLLMLWINLTGPRGVFKYYFTMFAPFFSIFASARMVRGKGEHVPVSLSMFLAPFVFTLLILLPDRDIYLLYVVLIFFVYLLTPLIDRFYDLVKLPFRYLKKHLAKRTDFGFETLSLNYRQRPSRLVIFFEILIVTMSFVAGSFLVVFGFVTTFFHIPDAIPVILQYFVLTGVMLFVGIQLVTIGTNGFKLSEEYRTDLNYLIKTLSYSLVTILLGFGIFSYLSSWSVDLFYQRQLLVLSSTIIVLWIFSLIVKIKIQLRLLVGSFIIATTGPAIWVWWTLGNPIMFLIGLTALIGFVIYFLMSLVSLIGYSKSGMINTNQDIILTETITEPPD